MKFVHFCVIKVFKIRFHFFLFRHLATELCMGTLEELMEGITLKNRSHLAILRHITTGVHYLHLLGIVHGNLKPSNILISYPKGDLKPMVKISDFGLQCAVRDDRGKIKCLKIASTEGWMCPYDSQDPLTSSFDIFPLGCLFGYTASNGIHPFGTNPVTRINKKHSMTLTLKKLESSSQSSVLLELIGKMVHYDATQRPSAFQVLDDIFFNQKFEAVQQQEIMERSDDQSISSSEESEEDNSAKETYYFSSFHYAKIKH